LHSILIFIFLYTYATGLILPSASNSYTEPGEGVFAVVEGQDVYVGRRSWVESCVGDVSSLPSSSGKSTTVWVGVKGRGIAGKLEFSDTLREDAKQVVKDLTGSGKQVVLLSGDDEAVARSAALEAGIDLSNVYGRVKPEGKAKFVTQLRENGASVAMIGDGVNDAVALSAADVGIAMGGGTDAAGAAADVVLMGDRLGQAVEALRLGGATLDKIKQNLGLAVIYNVVGIPLAAGVLLPSHGIALTPTVAAGMMACSSIVVVANSLLLRDIAAEAKSS
jgi:P-type E1-E2 ATPase